MLKERFLALWKILQKAKLISILLLLIVGAACVVFTVYQEQVEEPDLDDYHEGVPVGKYEWRSHNLLISSIGFACLIGGAILSVWLLLMRGRKRAAEKRIEDSAEAEETTET